jgi:sporulation protein YlmC with PRC-barrel domain
MLAKYIAAGIAGSVLLASAAFAEDPAATYQGDWRTSKVVGLNVYNDQNQNVGSINDLLTDKSGNIKAAVISVGGFLGLGSRYVAVPFEKLKFSTEPVPYTGAGASNTTPAKPSSTTTTGSAANPNRPASAPAPAVKPNPWYPDHAVFNATKDDLQAMPEFTYKTE